MGVSHGDARVMVSEYFLDFVEGVTCIDEKAGKGMAQIVQTDVMQAQSAAYGIPCVEKGADVSATSGIAGKNPLAVARQTVENSESFS